MKRITAVHLAAVFSLVLWTASPAVCAESAADPRDLKIAALEKENARMARELERLEQRNRELQDTLNRVRVEAGGDYEYRPS